MLPSTLLSSGCLRARCSSTLIPYPEVPHLLWSRCRRACVGKQQPPKLRPSFHTPRNSSDSTALDKRLAGASLLMHATVCPNKR